MTQHLILGAGPAGVIAAELIRKHAPNDKVIVVGDEPEPPYSRMAIPYLLIGNIDERGTYLRKGASHFADQKIELVVGRAKSINTAARKVTLDDGTVLAYDKLLIATGSKPVAPPIKGINLPGVSTCWTLEDARKIAALAKPGARVLQMGAGFIGCIIMEALAARGVKLSVVEMGDRMVPRMMGPVAGGMIKDWCETKGVKVFTGTRVEEISSAGGAAPAPAPSNGGLLSKLAALVGLGGPQEAPAAAGPLNVRMSNGETVEVDLVISATGVRPATAFLKGSGIELDVGVLTDAAMQTNVPGVYAAGDVAQAFDKATGKTVISAIQPNAADEAYVAAMNMLGRGAELKNVPQINVLDTLGLISTSFGMWQGVEGGQHIELTDKAGGRHLSLQFKDDVMVGCNSVGWTQHVGVMRGLVEGKVKLGEWKDRLMEDPTKLMDAYLASAQAQGQWSGARDERRR